MKVALYARVSTREQKVEQQLDSMIEKCKQENWEYEFFQDVISGAKDSRPSLDLMMQRVRANDFQAVMVWKLDRLGRSTLHLIQLVEELKNKDIQFISLTQGIDTQTAQGKFFLGVLAAFAELERELIRERTKSRIDRLKAQGKQLGRPIGARDKGQRRKAGYWIRWAAKKPTPQQIVDLHLQDNKVNK